MPIPDQEVTVRRHCTPRPSSRRPRLGFVGVGWIGRNRLRTLVHTGLAEVVAICDASPDALKAAAALAPQARQVDSFDQLMSCELDGVVIATPSALHHRQALAALRLGRAVICQKPLARTAFETQQMINAAREADVLLGVDFCYRDIVGATRMQELVRSGKLGRIFAIDLTFHNAYGPDKAWFYDPRLSGGGCVIDLGIHLADFAGWITGEWRSEDVQSTLWYQGQPAAAREEFAEDFAFAQWRQPGGATVRLTCSWNLSAGQDAVIEARFYGTKGSVALRNVDGSFFQFVCEHSVGTQRHGLNAADSDAKAASRQDAPAVMVGKPGCGQAEENTAWDEWGGKALVKWARRVGQGAGFDEGIASAASVAAVLDSIYGRESEWSVPVAGLNAAGESSAILTES